MNPRIMIVMMGVMLAQSIVGIRRMYFGIGMKKTVVALGRRSRKELQDGNEKENASDGGGLCREYMLWLY